MAKTLMNGLWGVSRPLKAIVWPTKPLMHVPARPWRASVVCTPANFPRIYFLFALDRSCRDERVCCTLPFA